MQNLVTHRAVGVKDFKDIQTPANLTNYSQMEHLLVNKAWK